MNWRRPFLGYDLFKLIVAVLLLVLLLWLLLGSPPPVASKDIPAAPAAALLPVETKGVAHAGMLEASVQSLPSETSLPAGTGDPPSRQQASPAADLLPATPSPPGAIQAQVDCPLAAPTRLKVGDRVRLVASLHLRSAPEISSNLIVTNPAGTELEITGGPVCIPFESGAHLWWEARMGDRRSGWSAEASAKGETYLMEPVE